MATPLPYPVYGCAYTHRFAIVDADGDLVNAAADLDSEISKDGASFNNVDPGEAVQVTGSEGFYSIDLSSTEMQADEILGQTKTSTVGAKTGIWKIKIQRPPIIQQGTAQAGALSTITLASTASAINDAYVGCIIRTTGGTGPGQGAQISGYVGSTKVATVDGTWATQPGATTTYDILRTERDQLIETLHALDQADLVSVLGSNPVGSVTGDVGGDVAGDVLGAVVGDVGGVLNSTNQTGDAFTAISSVNTRLTAPTGSVVAGSTTTSIVATGFVATDTDHWRDCYMCFASGDLTDQLKKITASTYNAGNSQTTFTVRPFTSAPDAGDTFEIRNK